MEYPLVSFLSPCYNHSDYIIESLDSVRLQTYPNIEHIIIDDCSTDDSVQKIEAWIEKHSYKCIFIKHKINKGISYTQNESITIAKGKYWTSLATDDIALPERTCRFVEVLEKDEKIPFVVSDATFINSKSELTLNCGYASFTKLFAPTTNFGLSNYGTYCSLILGNYVASSIMIRKSVFEKIGLYDAKLKVEDWDMWLRISRIFGNITYLNEYLTLYRLHATNVIEKNGYSMHKDLIKVFLRQKKFIKEYKLEQEYNERLKFWANEFVLKKYWYLLFYLFIRGNFIAVTEVISNYCIHKLKFYKYKMGKNKYSPKN